MELTVGNLHSCRVDCRRSNDETSVVRSDGGNELPAVGRTDGNVRRVLQRLSRDGLKACGRMARTDLAAVRKAGERTTHDGPISMTDGWTEWEKEESNGETANMERERGSPASYWVCPSSSFRLQPQQLLVLRRAQRLQVGLPNKLPTAEPRSTVRLPRHLLSLYCSRRGTQCISISAGTLLGYKRAHAVGTVRCDTQFFFLYRRAVPWSDVPETETTTADMTSGHTSLVIRRRVDAGHRFDELS